MAVFIVVVILVAEIRAYETTIQLIARSDVRICSESNEKTANSTDLRVGRGRMIDRGRWWSSSETQM